MTLKFCAQNFEILPSAPSCTGWEVWLLNPGDQWRSKWAILDEIKIKMSFKKLLTSQKGKPILVTDENYTFRIQRKGETKIEWICSSKDCKSRLHTDLDHVVTKEIGSHEHPADMIKIKNLEMAMVMKDNAAKQIPTGHIVAEALSSASTSQLAALPNLTSLKRKVQRWRNESSAAAPAPVDRQSFSIPDSFKVIGTDTFFQYDSGPNDGERILIFTTEKKMTDLKNHYHFGADGTFKVYSIEIYSGF